MNQFDLTQLSGGGALVLVIIASFAIDRVVTGSLFLLSFNRRWSAWFPNSKLIEDRTAKDLAERKQTLIYFSLAAFLAIVVLAGFGHLRLLSAMGIRPEVAIEEPAAAITPTPTPAADASPTATPAVQTTGRGFGQALFVFIDIVFTGLALVGGAETISKLLKMPGAPGVEKPPAKPVEIAGHLSIDQDGARDDRRATDREP